jgi:hypothetical protein
LVGFLTISLTPSVALARGDVHDFAGCMVRADASRMQAWVDFDGPGLIYKEISQVSQNANCAINTQFEYWTLRGALAEELSRPLFTTPLDLTAIPGPTDVDMALRWGNNDGRKSMLFNVFSECEVKSETGRVLAILTTAPDSKAEKSALSSLREASGPCRSLAGNFDLKERDPMIRARLAIALNQLIRRSAGADKAAS